MRVEVPATPAGATRVPDTWPLHQLAVLGSDFAATDSRSVERLEDLCRSLAVTKVTAFLRSPLPEFMTALRRAGGKAVLIADTPDTLRHTELFDAILTVDDPDAGDSIVDASCAGAICLTRAAAEARRVRGARTVILAVLEGDHWTVEVPGKMEHCGSATEALQRLSARFVASSGTTPIALLAEAKLTRQGNYPHGTAGSYLLAAKYYRAVALCAPLEETEVRHDALALAYDAEGNHAYYHEKDFLKAASLYHRGRKGVLAGGGQRTREELNRGLYFAAITLESIALAYAHVGEFALARQLVLEAIAQYSQAGLLASEESVSCYQHTVAGLTGWAAILQARLELAAGRAAEAGALLDAARHYYADALRLQPQWAVSGFSDKYDLAIKELEEVQGLVDRVRHGSL